MRSAVAASTGSVERDDAAERRALVALERPLVRVGEVVGERDAARVGVLDDRDRGRFSAEVVHQPPRGVGVVEVEVAEREAGVLLDVVPPARVLADRGSARRCWCGFSP